MFLQWCRLFLWTVTFYITSVAYCVFVSIRHVVSITSGYSKWEADSAGEEDWIHWSKSKYAMCLIGLFDGIPEFSTYSKMFVLTGDKRRDPDLKFLMEIHSILVTLTRLLIPTHWKNETDTTLLSWGHVDHFYIK